MFVMANSKNVVFFMVKNRCVRYGCVRYDGTPMVHIDLGGQSKSSTFATGCCCTSSKKASASVSIMEITKA